MPNALLGMMSPALGNAMRNIYGEMEGGTNLRPFDPAQDKPRANADGSYSTELSRTVYTQNGWANVPSLWWGNLGPVDLGQFSDDALANIAQDYEMKAGLKFPRFLSISEAESAAKQRSAKGGASRDKLARE